MAYMDVSYAGLVAPWDITLPEMQSPPLEEGAAECPGENIMEANTGINRWGGSWGPPVTPVSPRITMLSMVGDIASNIFRPLTHPERKQGDSSCPLHRSTPPWGSCPLRSLALRGHGKSGGRAEDRAQSPDSQLCALNTSQVPVLGVSLAPGGARERFWVREETKKDPLPSLQKAGNPSKAFPAPVSGSRV